MFVIPNQAVVPKCYAEFDKLPADEGGRMNYSSYRDRVVDVAEELYKTAVVMRPHTELLLDRYSEREEHRLKERVKSNDDNRAQKQSDADRLKSVASLTPPTSKTKH